MRLRPLNEKIFDYLSHVSDGGHVGPADVSVFLDPTLSELNEIERESYERTGRGLSSVGQWHRQYELAMWFTDKGFLAWDREALEHQEMRNEHPQFFRGAIQIPAYVQVNGRELKIRVSHWTTHSDLLSILRSIDQKEKLQTFVTLKPKWFQQFSSVRIQA